MTLENRKLTIALFSDSMLPILNGVSVSIQALVTGLRSRGHSVHLFTTRAAGHVDSDPNTHRFGGMETPWTRNYPLAFPPFYPMLREFRKHKFDLIHTHTPFTVGFVGLRWGESHSIPVVSTYHTLYDKYAHYIPYFPKRYLRYKVAKHTNYYYNRVAHVITPSEASMRWLQRHSVKTPVSVIPTGIPLGSQISRGVAREQLGIHPDQRLILYVGRIAAEKNLGRLFEAVSEVMRQDERTLFWLVGDGPMREQCVQIARDLRMGDRVRFIGFKPREEIEPYYAAADVFAFASMTETQGLVVGEAMMHGVPSVVVQGGGASEALQDRKNGILVRNDTEQLSAGILNLIQDEELRSRLSDGAFRTAQKMTVDAMVEQILGVYRFVLGEPVVTREEGFVT